MLVMLVSAENDYNFTVLSMSNHNQYAVSLAITNISSFFVNTEVKMI